MINPEEAASAVTRVAWEVAWAEVVGLETTKEAWEAGKVSEAIKVEMISHPETSKVDLISPEGRADTKAETSRETTKRVSQRYLVRTR